MWPLSPLVFLCFCCHVATSAHLMEETMEVVQLEEANVGFFNDDQLAEFAETVEDDEEPNMESTMPEATESFAYNGFPEALSSSMTRLPYKSDGAALETASDRSSATALSCGQTVGLAGDGAEYSIQDTLSSCFYHLAVPAGVTVTVSCPTYAVDCSSNNYLYLHRSTEGFYRYYCGPFSREYDGEIFAWQLNLRYLPGNGGGNIACKVRSSGGAAADPGPCGVQTAGAVGRIIDGGYAAEGEYPWQAHQRGIKWVTSTSYSYHSCGATLISNNYMLTAAHCLPPGVDEVRFCFGSIDNTNCRKTVTAPKENIIYHNDWDPSKASSVQPGDIALVRLPEPVEYDANIHINRACLPSSTPNDNTDIEMIGWGKIDATQTSNLLKKAWTRKVSRNTCVSNSNYKIICLNQGSTNQSPSGRSCQGDSGGYAGVGGTIYGVSSFTRMTETYPEECIAPNSYTDVYQYLSWINGHINASG